MFPRLHAQALPNPRPQFGTRFPAHSSRTTHNLCAIAKTLYFLLSRFLRLSFNILQDTVLMCTFTRVPVFAFFFVSRGMFRTGVLAGVVMPGSIPGAPRNRRLRYLVATRMKRPLILAGVAIFALIAGATSMYLLQRERRYAWISVVSDGGGFGMNSEALNGDIPWPDTTKPSGRVKFLNRDKGEQLGYVLKLPIKANPVSALPAKYRKTTKDANGLEFGPPDQVLYEGHFQFTLKDGDGFVLLRMDGPVEHLSAAAENSVQGTTDQTVPDSVIKRTKEVDVGFLVTSCNPCQAQWRGSRKQSKAAFQSAGSLFVFRTKPSMQGGSISSYSGSWR